MKKYYLMLISLFLIAACTNSRLHYNHAMNKKNNEYFFITKALYDIDYEQYDSNTRIRLFSNMPEKIKLSTQKDILIITAEGIEEDILKVINKIKFQCKVKELNSFNNSSNLLLNCLPNTQVYPSYQEKYLDLIFTNKY